jgi:predicted phosphoribosyltransferase
MQFLDRRDAGARLARSLEPYRKDHPLIIGLPRGGVPVADEIARALDAPLDIIVARKIGAPFQPEYALGAIAPGARVLRTEEIRALGIREAEIERTIAAETKEMERREQLYRAGRAPFAVEGRTVILVDDGLATGATARAALASLRARKPGRLIFAAPVGAPDSVDALRAIADEVVCLYTPEDFRAVGLHYRDFEPTSDAEVLACLERAAAAPSKS